MASRATVATQLLFLRSGLPARTQKSACWGASPNPASGQHGPKCQRRFAPYFHTPLTLLLLLPARLRIAQQIINVRLRRRDLPHFLPGLPVLGIEPLFLLRQLPAFLLQLVHLWQLRPAQNPLEVGAGRPVELNVSLMVSSMERVSSFSFWAGAPHIRYSSGMSSRPA